MSRPAALLLCPLGPPPVELMQAQWPQGAVALAAPALWGEPLAESLSRQLESLPEGAVLMAACSAGELAAHPSWAALHASRPGCMEWDGSELRPVPPPTPAGRLERSLALLACAAVSLIGAAQPIALSLPGPQSPRLVGAPEGFLPGQLWSEQWLLGALREGRLPAHIDQVYWPVGADSFPLLRSPLTAATAAPFHALFELPLSWNLHLAAILVVNGLAGAWMAWAVGASLRGAVLAAAILAGAPGVLIHLERGDPGSALLLPSMVALVAGWRAMHQGSAWLGAMAGLSCLLAGLSAPHHAALVVCLWAIAAAEQWWRWPDGRARLESAAGGALRVMLPLSLIWLPIWEELNRADFPAVGDLFDIPIAPVDFTETSQATFALSTWRLVPSEMWSLAQRPLTLLCGATLVYTAIQRRSRAWALTSAALIVLAMGPWMEESWTYLQAPLQLPYSLVMAAFPLAGRILAPDRLLPWAWLFGAMALALVWTRLVRHLPVWSRLGALVLACGAALSLCRTALPMETTVWLAPAWTRELREPGAVLHLPMGWSDAGAWAQLHHGRPTASGPYEAWELQEPTSTLRSLITDEDLGPLVSGKVVSIDQQLFVRLAERGLRYVVVHRGAIVALENNNVDLPLSRLAATVEANIGVTAVEVEGVSIYDIGSLIEGQPSSAAEPDPAGEEAP